MKGGWRGDGRRLLAPTAQRAGGRRDSQARQVGPECAHPGPWALALSTAGPAAYMAHQGRELATSLPRQLRGRRGLDAWTEGVPGGRVLPPARPLPGLPQRWAALRSVRWAMCRGHQEFPWKPVAPTSVSS